MIVYIEKIVILNLLIHVLIVYFTSNLFNTKVRINRLLISSLILSLNYTFSLFHHSILFYFLYFVFVFFTFKNFKLVIIYFCINFLLGGVISVVDVSSKYFYESSLILLLVIFVVIKITLKHKVPNEIIIVGNEVFKLKCFFDSGCLLNISGKPIIVVNSKFKIDLEFYTVMEIETIDSKKMCNVFVCNDVYFNNEKTRRNCYVIFKEIKFDCIIGSNFVGIK